MEETRKMVNRYGDQIWKNKDGQTHCDGDLPIYIGFDESQYWFKDGKIHRIHGSAAIWAYEFKEWSINLMISY